MKQEFDSAETDRLLEALYGDASDDGSASEAIGQLSANESVDLESLRSVRGMFADMADVDPPMEMTAGLLAAAAKAVAPAAVAQEAPRSSSKESLWARILGWFQPLLAHPGLAAAASLALVATIGGVLYMNNRGDLAEPPLADQRAKSASANATTDSTDAPAAKNPVLASPREEGPAFVAGEDAPDADDSTGEDSSAVEATALKRDLKRAKTKNSERKSGGKRVRDAAKIRTNEAKSLEKDFAASEVGTASGAGPSGTTSTGKGKKDAESPPLPTQAFEPGENANDDAPAQTPESPTAPSASTNSESTKKTTELAALKRQAAAAAERGDCLRARSLGAKVQAIDRRYFTGVFKTDREIRNCYATKKKK